MLAQTDPYAIAILVVPRYSHLSLAALIEPLRLANTVAGRQLYTWTLCSDGGGPVRSSSGISIEVDQDLADLANCDALFVAASYAVRAQVSSTSLRILRDFARRGALIGALDAGAYFLAEAGLLDGRRATIHWDDIEDFSHRYPWVDVVTDRFVTDGRFVTTSGSMPTFDCTLDLIRRRDGLALASNVSGNFIYDMAQPGSAPQAMVSVAHLRGPNPKIARIVKLMEQTLRAPLPIRDLAATEGFSERTFSRRFREALGTSPGDYYRTLRLDLGRRLLESSDLAISEISVACGFETRGAFTRAFGEAYGTRPSGIRAAHR